MNEPSIWEKYKDELPEDLDDYYYGGSGGGDREISGDALVIDTRSLEKDTSGLKSIGSYKTAKQYFAALEKYIKKLGTASMNRSFAKVVPDILDGYVRYNSMEGGGFGYNDYYGGLIHNYYARLFIGGRQVLLRRVSEDVSPWGKIRRRNKRAVFRIMRRRHSVKRRRKMRWYTPKPDRSVHTKFQDIPTFKDGKRQKFMDVPLNWRGRRLKGRKGGKFRYRVKAPNTVGVGGYRYEFYYGHKQVPVFGNFTTDKNGKSVGQIVGYRDNGGDMRPYIKKQKYRPKDMLEVKDLYRHVHKNDRFAQTGYKRYVLSGWQNRPKAKATMEIFNAAPYSRRVAMTSGGRYQVLPAIKVRDGWRKQIATMMKHDFDKFLKGR